MPTIHTDTTKLTAEQYAEMCKQAVANYEKHLSNTNVQSIKIGNIAQRLQEAE